MDGSDRNHGRNAPNLTAGLAARQIGDHRTFRRAISGQTQRRGILHRERVAEIRNRNAQMGVSRYDQLMQEIQNPPWRPVPHAINMVPPRDQWRQYATHRNTQYARDQFDRGLGIVQAPHRRPPTSTYRSYRESYIGTRPGLRDDLVFYGTIKRKMGVGVELINRRNAGSGGRSIPARWERIIGCSV